MILINGVWYKVNTIEGIMEVADLYNHELSLAIQKLFNLYTAELDRIRWELDNED